MGEVLPPVSKSTKCFANISAVHGPFLMKLDFLESLSNSASSIADSPSLCNDVTHGSKRGKDTNFTDLSLCQKNYFIKTISKNRLNKRVEEE